MTAQFRIIDLQNLFDVDDLFITVSPLLTSQISLRKLLELLEQLYGSVPLAPAAFDTTIRGFGLADKIKQIEEERASKFFSPENLERIGRRAGKPRFVAELQDMCDNPQNYTPKQKLQMAQFVSDQYNEAIGAPRTTVKFYDGDPNTLGFFRPGGDTIFLNRNNSEISGSFVKMLGTVVHENTHNDQFNANVYGNPVLSRVYRAYRANFENYRDARTYGYNAYKSQLVEVGAFAAGNMAESMLHRLCASNDNSLRPASVNRVHGFHLAA